MGSIVITRFSPKTCHCGKVYSPIRANQKSCSRRCAAALKSKESGKLNKDPTQEQIAERTKFFRDLRAQAKRENRPYVLPSKDDLPW